MQRRRLRGPARYYVAALVVVLVAVGLVVVARTVSQPPSAALPTPGAASPPGAESPLRQALDGIRDDGTWSKDTALAAFAAAFGPLPDVPVPPADPTYHSGTAALEMVEAKWSELTDAQRQAIRAYLGPVAPEVVPAAFHGVALDTYQTLAEQAATDIAAHLGRPLGMPIEVVPLRRRERHGLGLGHRHLVPDPAGAASPPVQGLDPTVDGQGRVTRALSALADHPRDVPLLRAHAGRPRDVAQGAEVGHARARPIGSPRPSPTVSVNPRASMSTGTATSSIPSKKLYARAYDAMGFFAQLAQIGIDPWTVLDATYKAAAEGSDAAFEASGANTPTFTDRWGSSWYRDGLSNAAWAMSSGIRDHRARATTATPGSDPPRRRRDRPRSRRPAHRRRSPNLQHDRVHHPRSRSRPGTARVGERRAGGLDKVVRVDRRSTSARARGATAPARRGRRPLGSTPQVAPQDLRLAATGEEHTTTVVDRARDLDGASGAAPKILVRGELRR